MTHEKRVYSNKVCSYISLVSFSLLLSIYLFVYWISYCIFCLSIVYLSICLSSTVLHIYLFLYISHDIKVIGNMDFSLPPPGGFSMPPPGLPPPGIPPPGRKIAFPRYRHADHAAGVTDGMEGVRERGQVQRCSAVVKAPGWLITVQQSASCLSFLFPFICP